MKTLIDDIFITKTKFSSSIEKKKLIRKNFRENKIKFNNMFSEKNKNCQQNSRLLFKKRYTREKILENFHNNLIDSYLFYFINYLLHYSFFALV